MKESANLASTNTISLAGTEFNLYLSNQQIENRIEELAICINCDNQNQKYHHSQQTPLFIVVLKGASFFASHLLKNIRFDCTIDFVKLSSYEGMTTSGNFVDSIGLTERVEGREIVVVEDIIDTGRTMIRFLDFLRQKEAKNIKIASLLHKPAKTEYPIEIDYKGFTIPEDKFVVGYGLDFYELGRNYPDIYST